MSKKISGKARPAAAGETALGGGLGCGMVPMAGRDTACWRWDMERRFGRV